MDARIAGHHPLPRENLRLTRVPHYFAPAARGTESVLADELGGLGLDPVEVGRGGVAFGRSLEHAYRACLWSRVASRIDRSSSTSPRPDVSFASAI